MSEDTVILAVDYKSSQTLFQNNRPDNFVVRLNTPIDLDSDWWMCVVSAYASANVNCLVGLSCDLCEETYRFGENCTTLGEFILKKSRSIEKLELSEDVYYKVKKGLVSYVRFQLLSKSSNLSISDLKIVLRLVKKRI